eukprot:Gb_25074 [translate_table: standard]
MAAHNLHQLLVSLHYWYNFSFQSILQTKEQGYWLLLGMVNHMIVRTKEELETALLISQETQLDLVIEATSHIEDNTAYHRVLQQSARQAANHTFKILSGFSHFACSKNDSFECDLLKMEYWHYRQVCKAF